MRTFIRAFAMPLVLAGGLSACVTSLSEQSGEGIGYRQARFEEIAAMREYRACRDDGLELDKQARRTGAVGQYAASAKLLEKCESLVGDTAPGLATEERMRAFAVSIQNHFKGGDVGKAAAGLEKFKKAFGDNDLYFADGSSFVESMEVLVGMQDRSKIGSYSTHNVNVALLEEMQRLRHWKQN